MKTITHTFADPAANLAADEVLLEAREEVLRFWESPVPFVVVGYANHRATEVNLPACAARGVPVLRRCSGGGTVVQGPGCLNYALVLRTDREAALGNVTATNRYIMERHRTALSRLLGQPVSCDGHTDLALAGRKFSGNAQRRRKHSVLFHGTFLLNSDLALIEELLRFPSKQPPYRQGRAHTDFVMNLHRPAEDVQAALRQCWGAREPLPALPVEQIARLVREQYATAEWTEKF